MVFTVVLWDPWYILWIMGEKKCKKILRSILATEPLKVMGKLNDSSILVFYSVSNACLEVNGVDFGLALPHSKKQWVCLLPYTVSEFWAP